VEDVLADRTANAIGAFRDIHPDMSSSPVLVVAGGVAANEPIRKRLKDLAAEKGFQFVAPPPNLCTDNAAMIAWAGIERLKLGLTDDFDFQARPRWPLDPDAPPAPGAGVKA
jgi:N6-L-threonylcarbamoyladenine synthase